MAEFFRPTKNSILKKLALSAAVGSTEVLDADSTVSPGAAPTSPAPMVGDLWLGFRLPLDTASTLEVPGSSYEPASDLHCTLAMFSDLTADQAQQVLEVVSEVCADCDPLTGSVIGYGRFLNSTTNPDGKDVVYASFDCPQLPEFRQKIMDAASACDGVEPMMNHGYIPHITLAYVNPHESVPTDHLQPVEMSFDALCASHLDSDYAIHLKGADTSLLKFAVFKQEAEKRYVFGPVYKPDSVDAHGEFMTADELQQAQWQYVRSGNRNIYVQHGMISSLGFKQAGEWVDIVCWPAEATFVLQQGSGKSFTRTLPANTVYLGVILNDFAWNLVRNGTLNSFSFGGFAKRVKPN